MSAVLLVIHLIIAIALVVVVLLQRSEGGALGIGGGGGGGGGGLFTGRGAANFFTRATAALAGAFFLTSIALTLLARSDGTASSILDQIGGGSSSGESSDSVLPNLPAGSSQGESALPSVPGSSEQPANNE
ncbi:MAG: preprotein translocase subunit SecG [Hyphomicrobiales bacterium]